ncbi:MAG TPA: T9SS type A sorting domain-containing protein, partial [Saprospiraceae bacterium]
NWSKVDVGLPDIEPYTLWYYHHPLFFRDANAHYAFLGNDGHFISTDFSSPWMDMKTSLTGYDYLIIDNTIYLGSEGLYKSVIENPLITAVEDIHKDANHLFTISPNPTDDFIRVSMKNVEAKAEIRLILYDTNGDLVKSHTYNSSENIRIDIQGLPSGIYLLQAHTAEGTGVVKIVKN